MDENLFSVDQIEQLSIKEVHDLYKKYVNPGQVELISAFGFGWDQVEYAEEEKIVLKSGRTIYDFTGGIGVLNHGHNHPRILEARKTFQEKKRLEVHKNFFSPYIAGLSANISKLLPEDLNISYFPNSGGEAVEGAIKMAYKYHEGNRSRILCSDRSFHGKLLGSASVTKSPEVRFKFPQIPGVHEFKFGCIESIKKQIETLKNNRGTDVYAILVEPFSASSLTSSGEDFLKELRQICFREDIILIYDEVYTGWAKTGHLFNFMQFENCTPDILTMAKSFGGGKASISGFVAREKVFNKAYGNLEDSIIHSTTYNGFGEETITAIEAVNIIIEDDYVGKARELNTLLTCGLSKLKRKYPNFIQEIRGEGALMGLKFVDNFMLIKQFSKIIPSKMFKDSRFSQKLITGAVINYLYCEKNILTFFGSNQEILLIISPSLITSKESIDYFLKSLDETIEVGLFQLLSKFVKFKFSGK